MPSFISDTLDDILKTTQKFEEVVFILPSQRAGVFFKKELQKRLTNAFLPDIFNIENFIAEISETHKADTIPLLFEFYTIYKSFEKTPDSFAKFSSWAITVIQDFNEIDQHLVDTKDIFSYLRDIERLKKWSVKGDVTESELMKNHHHFIERLYEYYTKFYEFQLEQKYGYQGFMYREAVKKTATFLQLNTHKKFFFIGFNALNKAEEYIFQAFLAQGNTEIYWDIDITFFKGNHQAGKFIRTYKNEWKHFEKHPIKTIHNSFSEPKNIEVIGVAKNVMQLKHAGEILNSLSSFEQTALILADETLLPIALNSLPKKVENINITMGYPLQDMPATSLISIIFNLFLTQEKLQKKEQNAFYYKDVLAFFNHQLIQKLINSQNSNTAVQKNLTELLTTDNATFLSFKKISKIIKTSNLPLILEEIFLKLTTIEEFLNRLLALIDVIKSDVNVLEKEYLYRINTTLTQLQNLNSKYPYFENLKVLSQFFTQIISSETLSFHGEPLKGLQLMGMLETRLLDFENIIITSVNEGVLPKNNLQSSFIPFDVKVNFNLPTYREKDAIFSYHFFRVLQRAKNVFLIYNTESDDFGKGEKSRFINQLVLIKNEITFKKVNAAVITKNRELQEIAKDEAVFDQLKILAKKGISPSALTNYLLNPISFYKQKILKIDEFQEVEETVAFNTLGNVVHDTLDELYTPFKGKFLKKEDVELMQQQYKSLIPKYFKKYFKSGDVNAGKNRLIFEVAQRFVKNFLQQEKQLVSNTKNQLKIIDTEPFLDANINVDGIPFPIKIHGKIDRIDELNGVTRIIDYKTGKVELKNLKVADFEHILESEKHKAIQVLLYCFLYTSHTNFDFNKSLEAGVFSFKNLNSGFLKVDFSPPRKSGENQISKELLLDFMEIIKGVLKEIYNTDILFKEPEPEKLPSYYKK